MSDFNIIHLTGEQWLTIGSKKFWKACRYTSLAPVRKLWQIKFAAFDAWTLSSDTDQKTDHFEHW